MVKRGKQKEIETNLKSMTSMKGRTKGRTETKMIEIN